MIKVMQDNYSARGNTMNVTDLSHACATKTQAEVTKAFTSAVSFILSNAVEDAGDKKGGKKKKVLAKKPTGKPLWNPKKFEPKQFFSQTAYLKVKSMNDVGITVKNSYGNEMFVSRDILQGMYSADHFKKEQAMNMSGLAELLQSVQDHVFTVTFRKQQTEQEAAEMLQAADKSTFTDSAKLGKLSKELLIGKTCKMVCKMV